MRKPIAQRIKELEERKRILQSRLGKQERAQETRRKILLGSFVLERLAKDDDPSDPCDLRQWLLRDLPTFLDRDADRALFGGLLWKETDAQATRGDTGLTDRCSEADGFRTGDHDDANDKD